MLNFKPLSIEDKAIFDKFLSERISMNAGNSFTNLFAYNFIYPCEYAVTEDSILSRIYLRKNHISYYEPTNKSIVEYLPQIEELHKQDNVCISFILEHKESIDFFKQNDYFVKYSEDLSEYVYSREKLQSFSGRKLQSKRNHINKFLSLYPSWQYVEISKEDKQDCLQLTDVWLKEVLNLSPQYLQDYTTERKVIETLFDYFDELGLYGGAIKVDGQVVAYSIGSFLKDNTFDTNIEKASRSVEGAFAMMNREIAKHLPQQIEFINREEDKGIAGLRKAKQSYYPLQMVYKYVAYKNE